MDDIQKPDAGKRRRFSGAVLARAPLTRAERDVVAALLYFWTRRHTDPENYMAPGVDGIAKKARVTSRTACRALAILRDCGVLEAPAHLNVDRRGRTGYIMNLDALAALCGSK